MKLSQKTFAQAIAQASGMKHANDRFKTYINGHKMHGPKPREEMTYKKVVKYQILVGDLRYLEDCTRPYLTYIVGNGYRKP